MMQTILTIINLFLFVVLIVLIAIQILIVHIFVTYVLMKLDKRAEDIEAEYSKE